MEEEEEEEDEDEWETGWLTTKDGIRTMTVVYFACSGTYNIRAADM